MEMNFYSHAAAYSLFPWSSFDMQWTILCNNEHLEPVYFPGGFEDHLPESITRKSCIDPRMRKKIEDAKSQRAIGDSWTWTLPFPDAQQIVQRAFPSSSLPSSTPSSHTGSRLFLQCGDPSSLNSFTANMKGNALEIEYDVFACRGLARDAARNRNDEYHIVLSRLLSQKLQLRFSWSNWSIDRDAKVWGSRVWKEAFARWCSISVKECTCRGEKKSILLI